MIVRIRDNEFYFIKNENTFTADECQGRYCLSIDDFEC